MRKSASFYSDFIGENPLSRLVGIDMNSGGGVANLLGFKTHESPKVEWLVFHY
jgi:hypothetical protein